jgi:hypothetical protein
VFLPLLPAQSSDGAYQWSWDAGLAAHPRWLQGALVDGWNDTDRAMRASGQASAKAAVRAMAAKVPPPSLLAIGIQSTVYGSTKGFASYGGFTHVGFPRRMSVSLPHFIRLVSNYHSPLSSLSLSRHDVTEFQPQL